MKKIHPYVMTLVLMAGGAVYGAAQTTYSGPPVVKAFFDEHERWEEGRAQAQQMGFQDGMHDGRADFEHRRKFHPTEDGSYKHADHGYDRRYGDRGRYQQEYREAYERGYRQGYYPEGRHEGREEHEHDPR